MSAPESEPQQEPSPKFKESQPMPIWMRWGILVLAVVCLFIVQNWFLGAKANDMRRSVFQRDVAALAVALQPSLLTRNTDAVRPLTTAIASAGSYFLVVVTDPSGRVIGTTDRLLDGTTISDMANPNPSKVLLKDVDGGLQATAAIALGGNNVIGTLRVVMPKQ